MVVTMLALLSACAGSDGGGGGDGGGQGGSGGSGGDSTHGPDGGGSDAGGAGDAADPDPGMDASVDAGTDAMLGCPADPGACSEEVCDGDDNDGDTRIDENSYVCFEEEAAETIDDLIAGCPSPAQVRAIDADLDLRFEHGELSGGDPEACSAAESGRVLDGLQRNMYLALIALRALHFSEPLPWTDEENLYVWLLGNIGGVRTRDDIANSYCCMPIDEPQVLYANLRIGPSGAEDKAWMDASGVGIAGLAALLVHEAHHRDIPHSCGNADDTIGQLGAWGVQYYFYKYLAYHTDPCFMRPGGAQAARPEGSYMELAAREADSLHGSTVQFCAEPSIPREEPAPVPVCGASCEVSAEVCNLVDDDCDGTIDEDANGYACGTDAGECSVGVVTACDRGLERCDGELPIREVCGDALDNDCDDMVDEGGCGACAGVTTTIIDDDVYASSAAQLAALAGVGCITGQFQIQGNVTDLTPLADLEAVGGDMWIYNTSALESLVGLSSLRHTGRLFVRNNSELTSLVGLESLARIDTFHLLIDGNPKLVSVDGLSGLTHIEGQIGISDNPLLESLSGLSSIDTVGGSIGVRDNASLPQCEADALVARIGDGKVCNACTGNDGAGSCD